MEKRLNCGNCKRSFPVSELKYYPQGKDSAVLLCKECGAKIKKKPDAAENKASKSQKEAAANPKRGSYLCERCNYKFKYDPKGRTDLLCPYCGRADKILKDKPMSAEDVLKDSEGY